MRKLLIFLSIIFLCKSVSGQIQKVIDTSTAIEGRMSNSFYQQSSDQRKDISSILNIDVFKYYNLEEQYDTELKKKNFKNTEDYQGKFNALKLLKKSYVQKLII